MPFRRIIDFFRGSASNEKSEFQETAEEKNSSQVEQTKGEDPEILKIENELRTRFLGCFLGLAIGDAKGMPAESKDIATANEIAACFDYLPGYLPAGSYTDDTHHTIMVAETLIEDESGKFDQWGFTGKLSNSELHRGIGPTSFKAIQRLSQGYPLDQIASHSDTNGPAMRVAPLALLYHHDINELREQTIKSAEITHKGALAVGGALTISFAVSYMLNHYQEPFDKAQFTNELIAFIKPYSHELAESFKEENALYERTGCHVMESVPHAIRIFMADPYDFEKAIQKAIEGGGDADTIASMVGAISGTFNGLEKIPQLWIDKLENSPKGREYIQKLALKLYEMNKEKRTNQSTQE